MSNYEKANGDNRDILERYLPAVFRRSTDGSEEHNAFLGAIKGMISTAESDLTENVKQLYLSKASGSFLDLYGKWVGLSRGIDEADDKYRTRIEDYIVTERATISGIISGIRRDMNNPELPITIYEPWRNIFIINKSLLNGPDRIMGNFYRYAVIQITVGKYIDKVTLDSIVMRYKAYGIYVYYTYSSPMTGDVLHMPLTLAGTGMTSISRDSIYNDYTLGINDLPNGATTDDLFIVSKSSMNTDKLLAGSPEKTFAYQYGTVPSKNIFGIIPSSVSPSSYTDPYDYIYQNTKVDLSTVGDRNYVLNSSCINGSALIRPTLSGTSSSSTSTVTYPSDGILMTNGATNTTSEWYYQVANAWTKFSDTPLNPGDQITFSADVMGNVPQAVLRCRFNGGSGGKESFKSFDINNTSWTRVSITVSSTSTNTGLYFRIQGGINNQYENGWSGGETLKFRYVKIEKGNQPTDWTPAPEDTPKTYIYPYKNTSYVNMGRNDDIYESVKNTTTSKVNFAFNLSEYLSGKGYLKHLTNFNRDTVDGVILSVLNSPYGTSATTISVYSTSGSLVKGAWYMYDNNSKGTLVGQEIPASSRSTGSYIYILDTKQTIGRVVINDYYPGTGSYRSVSLSSAGKLLRVYNTSEQTTGSVSLPSSMLLNGFYLSAYIDSVSLNLSSSNNDMSVYDYKTDKWVVIDSNTNLLPYISTGTTTGATYLLLRSNISTQLNIDYIGLKIKSYT